MQTAKAGFLTAEERIVESRKYHSRGQIGAKVIAASQARVANRAGKAVGVKLAVRSAGQLARTIVFCLSDI